MLTTLQSRLHHLYGPPAENTHDDWENRLSTDGAYIYQTQ